MGLVKRLYAFARSRPIPEFGRLASVVEGQVALLDPNHRRAPAQGAASQDERRRDGNSVEPHAHPDRPFIAVLDADDPHIVGQHDLACRCGRAVRIFDLSPRPRLNIAMDRPVDRPEDAGVERTRRGHAHRAVVTHERNIQPRRKIDVAPAAQWRPGAQRGNIPMVEQSDIGICVIQARRADGGRTEVPYQRPPAGSLSPCGKYIVHERLEYRGRRFRIGAQHDEKTGAGGIPDTAFELGDVRDIEHIAQQPGRNGLHDLTGRRGMAQAEQVERHQVDKTRIFIAEPGMQIDNGIQIQLHPSLPAQRRVPVHCVKQRCDIVEVISRPVQHVIDRTQIADIGPDLLQASPDALAKAGVRLSEENPDRRVHIGFSARQRKPAPAGIDMPERHTPRLVEQAAHRRGLLGGKGDQITRADASEDFRRPTPARDIQMRLPVALPVQPNRNGIGQPRRQTPIDHAPTMRVCIPDDSVGIPGFDDEVLGALAQRSQAARVDALKPAARRGLDQTGGVHAGHPPFACQLAPRAPGRGTGSGECLPQEGLVTPADRSGAHESRDKPTDRHGLEDLIQIDEQRTRQAQPAGSDQCRKLLEHRTPQALPAQPRDALPHHEIAQVAILGTGETAQLPSYAEHRGKQGNRIKDDAPHIDPIGTILGRKEYFPVERHDPEGELLPFAGFVQSGLRVRREVVQTVPQGNGNSE
ncbi:Uncharacterised protein [Bordetella pertussis]|nr:Uncharacterised protein [Bordetella pertussis]